MKQMSYILVDSYTHSTVEPESNFTLILKKKFFFWVFIDIFYITVKYVEQGLAIGWVSSLGFEPSSFWWRSLHQACIPGLFYYIRCLCISPTSFFPSGPVISGSLTVRDTQYRSLGILLIAIWILHAAADAKVLRAVENSTYYYGYWMLHVKNTKNNF
jgi:hypothetical protein